MTVLSVGGLAMPRSSASSRKVPIPSTITFVDKPPDTTPLNKAASVCNRIIIIIIHHHCSFIRSSQTKCRPTLYTRLSTHIHSLHGLLNKMAALYHYTPCPEKEATVFLHNFNKCRHRVVIFWHEPSRVLILLRK